MLLCHCIVLYTSTLQNYCEMLTSSKYIFYEYFIVLSNLRARHNLAMGGGAAVQKLEYASSNVICELKTTNFRCSLQCQINMNLVFATQALSASKQDCNYFC